MFNIIGTIASFKKYQVCLLTSGKYCVYKGDVIVQKNMSANDCIRYLAHILESK